MSKRSHQRGDPSGEWRRHEGGGAPGRPEHPDPAATDELAPGEIPARGPGSDPYNQDDKPEEGPESPRRSLDDMRRLSEAIKTAPTWTAPKKSGTVALVRRLDALRVDLQRILDEINGLRQGGRDESHARALMVQLRDAAHHLGEAINSLLLKDK
jgi:hypothetical protein